MPTFISGEQSSVIARTDVTVLNQNVTANSTSIKIMGYMYAPRSGHFSGATIWAGLYVDGALVAQDRAPRTLPSGGIVAVFEQTRSITHNADGSKTANISINTISESPGTIVFNQWAGGNVVLPKIARATTPNISGGGGFTTGSESTIGLPRATTTYVHDVSYKLGTKSGTIATDAGTSTTFTPPDDLMTELPNAASGSITITVVTKLASSGAVIGTTNMAFPLTAGASVVPTVSSVLWDDANTAVKAAIGAFVQGLSLIKGTVAASGVHGSIISAKRLIVSGQPFPENTTFQIASSGTVTASGEATDSRGRSGVKAGNFTVLGYEPPKLGNNGWQVRRANVSNVPDDSGQYLRVDLHAIANSLVVGTEKNALKVTVRTRPSNGAWTNRNIINPGLTHNGAFQVSGGAAFLVSQSYEVEITLSDNTGTSVVLRTVIGTAVVALDLNGSSVGVGKMHEFGALDVAGDIYSSGVRVPRLDELPSQATNTVLGISSVASQSEVNAGTNAAKYVTPETLHGWDTGWIAATVTGGTNNATYPAKYRRVGKTVYLSGRVTPSANAQTLFTLPVGFRVAQSFTCAAWRIGQVPMSINTSGAIHYVGPGGDGYIELSSLPPFIAEQ